MTKIGSAFLPVHNPAAAATWYHETFGLTVESADTWSAVLADEAGRRLTLLGPASGIQAQPGLPWATHNLVVEDLDSAYARLQAVVTSGIDGDPAVCRFFTMPDPDGNTLLVCDR
ncbi:MAG: VOC family protein [Hamadaea sp.]|nr:VOC family protein [Hamadaea sp.]NUR49559.1 VOC family protein [Hamadaea sp.]NUT06215.1 VOC family protein [Hamadaea sp.]